MRKRAAAMALTVAATLAAFLAPGGLRPAQAAELGAAVGGADTCWTCFTGTTCKDKNIGKKCEFVSDGVYLHWVGSDIDPQYCLTAATGVEGNTKCDSDTPKVCVTIYTCREKDPKTGECKNCGEPGTEEKQTNCKLGDAKYKCTG